MLTRKSSAKAMEVLEVVDLPIVEPGPGELRVRVRAVGIGATDLMMFAGYRYAPKIPFVPGYEIAGVVDAMGPGVEGFHVGQRVAALTVYGGFGELVVRGAARKALELLETGSVEGKIVLEGS
jgi:NADPH:quinone reductase